MTCLRHHIIFIMLLLSTSHLLAQEDLTGVWEGVMGKVVFQKNSGQYLQVNIIQQGNKICGYTYDSVINHPGDYCKAIFEGVYDKRRDLWVLTGKQFIENSGTHVFMRIRLWNERRYGKDKLETEVGLKSWPDQEERTPGLLSGIFRIFGLEEDNVMQNAPEYLQLKRVASQAPEMPMGFAPCFPPLQKPKDTLQHVVIGEKPVVAKPGDTPFVVHTPLLLNRNDTPSILHKMTERKKTTLSHLPVDVKFITLKLYDNAIVDGDTVTIFYNGKLLVSKQLLSEKPIVINLTLDEKASQHEIVLYAENLGSIPPNTALIVVTAGDKRYELHASASLEENAVLVFDYSPKEN